MGWAERWKPLDRLLALTGRALVDAVYPLECAGCGRTGQVICDRCLRGVARLEPPFCRVCSAPGAEALCDRCSEMERYFNGIRAPFLHAGVIRQAVHAFKYDGISAAAPQLGSLMSGFLESNPLEIDVVAPVPMHPRRRRERGYNQAELLAKEVAQRCGLLLDAGMLTRVKHLAPQATTANMLERTNNVAGNVAVSDGRSASGLRVLLIDDVATTGSTLDACAGVLKRDGVTEVWCLTLAVAGAPAR